MLLIRLSNKCVGQEGEMGELSYCVDVRRMTLFYS